MKNDKNSFHPTDELVESARAALTEDGTQEFWTEVQQRLDEYGAEKLVSPRPRAEK